MTAGPARACPAGHQLGPGKPGRACPGCRRDGVVARVAAADQSLTGEQVAAAVDAVAATRQVLRSLAVALAGGQAGEVLAAGAPPAVGRLLTELISLGSSHVHAGFVRNLRTHRLAVDPFRACRDVFPLPEPGARDRLRPLRHGQARRRAHRRRRAALRTLPPPRARAPALRELREDRSDRRPGPQRRQGRVRELLPDAAGPLPGLRPPPGRATSLTAAIRSARRARRGPRASAHAAAWTGRRCTLARGPGLRHLLHKRAAPPRRRARVRSAAAADRAARPGGDHVRGLRRAAADPSVRAVRRRGQAVRERPVRPLQPARPGRDLLAGAGAEAVAGLTVVH